MSICSSCQQAIPADAPHGVCPTCLYRLVGGGGAEDGGGNRPTTASRGDPPALPDREAIARAFPQLEVLELLGSGGMGAVYKVRQRALDRVAALKLLNPELAGDPNFQERFTREARLMARLVHPNIAMIFEFGQAGLFYYLLMEFVDGVNLRAAIRQRTICPEDSLRIVPQICDALQYAHDAGVIHRDIKPENILLDRVGNVKLVDFGLAKLHGAPGGHPSLTGTQQVMGTMNYMAPEQWERPNQIDHRADIFSLGVVFYELLTGELPLGRFSPPSARAAVDQRIDPVVLRTLEKDPNARFQTAQDVKTAVSSFQSDVAPRPPRFEPPSAGAEHILASMPFTVGDSVNHWETNGIATLRSDGLHLEYTKRDRWFGTKQGIAAVDLRLSDIASVALRNGPVTKGIEIQTKNLMCLRDFPYADELSLVLRTAAKCRPQRDQLFGELSRLLGQTPSSYADQLRAVDDAKARVQGPAIGLFATGVLDLLGAIAFAVVALGAVLFPTHTVLERRGLDRTEAPTMVDPDAASVVAEQVRDAAREVAEVESAFGMSPEIPKPNPPAPPESSVVVHQPLPLASRPAVSVVLLGVASIALAVGLWSTVGVFLILVALRMRRLRSYGLSMAGNIVALVPLHPAALVGIPVGIYGIVVLASQQVYSAFERLAELPFDQAGKK